MKRPDSVCVYEFIERSYGVCVFIEDAYAVCVAVCSCLFWDELGDGGSAAWHEG